MRIKTSWNWNRVQLHTHLNKYQLILDVPTSVLNTGFVCSLHVERCIEATQCQYCEVTLTAVIQFLYKLPQYAAVLLLAAGCCCCWRAQCNYAASLGMRHPGKQPRPGTTASLASIRDLDRVLQQLKHSLCDPLSSVRFVNIICLDVHDLHAVFPQ